MMYWPALTLLGLGMLIVLTHKQAVLLFMGIEMMLGAANWTILLALNHSLLSVHSAALILFTIAVAAAEAVIGLAIVMRLARRYHTIDISQYTTLKDREE